MILHQIMWSHSSGEGLNLNSFVMLILHLCQNPYVEGLKVLCLMSPRSIN